MTREEWLASSDPSAMLRLLLHNEPSWRADAVRPTIARPSDRKLRLFACACCRQVWHLLTDERCRKAVEVAEQYADGLTAANERGKAFNAADGISDHFQRALAYGCLRSDPAEGVREVLRALLKG